MLCDQLLNSASSLSPMVMRPLLHSLARLGTSTSGSSLDTSLMIYIQKQLWATSASTWHATSTSATWQNHESARAEERRKLASLFLAEALVINGQRGRAQGGIGRVRGEGQYHICLFK